MNLNLILAMMLSILLIGCEAQNDLVARVATQAADRQALQNQEMANLNREVATGTRRLVEEDAATRNEFARVHREIQAERTQLSGDWGDLEKERKQITTVRLEVE